VGPWFDYTINGLVIGNIYALLGVGLALIFGVANLINFAHGSVFTVGAYLGWTAIRYLHTPLPATVLIVAAGGAAVGAGIERFALRPLLQRSRIAPLLATIGVGLVLDHAVQLVFSADPHAMPSQLPDWRLPLGGVTIGASDLLIAGFGVTAAALLFGFLRFSKLGWAVRATAQDSDAARQMGVDTDRVNMAVFAIASALGAVGGLLVGMFYHSIDTTMSFDATLKGMVAMLLGGLGNVPGAIAGGLILGLAESYGVALFGASYRNLFAFVLMILILAAAPNGLFTRRRELPPEPMTGTFVAPSKPLRLPRAALVALVAAAGLFPLVWNEPYLLQTLANALLMALLAFGLTLNSDLRHGRTNLARPRRASGHRRLRLGTAGARPRLALRGQRAGGALDHCASRRADRAAGAAHDRPLRRHRHPRHRRDRRPRDLELERTDAWAARPIRHSRPINRLDRGRFAACALLADARAGRAVRVAASSPARFSSRPDLAGDPRGRGGGPGLWGGAAALQGARFRLRRFRRRRRRGHCGASVLLHQPRHLRHAALDPGDYRGDSRGGSAMCSAPRSARRCWSACPSYFVPPPNTGCSSMASRCCC